MPNTFARCLNTDYCSLGDRRLVMRLDDGEPLFCPECAQSLALAPPWDQRHFAWPVLGALVMAAAAMTSGYMVVQRWPRATDTMASPPAGYWVQAPRQGSAGAPVAWIAAPAMEPSPAKLYLAAAMDDFLPPAAGDFVLRPRRGRPPRLDAAVSEAIASLQQGVPLVPWPRDDSADESMPWRQALIMSALVSPGGALSAAPAAEAAPPDVVPPPSLPAAAPPAAAISPLTAPDAMAVPQAPHVAAKRPQAALQPAMPPAAAKVLQLGHANLTVQNKVVPVGLKRMILAISFVRPAPALKLAGHAAPPRALTKLAITEAISRHSAGSRPVAKQSAPAEAASIAPPAAAPAPLPAQAAAGDTSHTQGAALPPAKIVVVPSGFSMSYTPLKDVNLTSIVMPARPSADKPRKGSLQVDCMVDTSGLPSGCRVVHAERAAAVSNALLAWLSSGLVHRAPTVRNGQKVSARQTWSLEFPAESQRGAEEGQ